MQVFVDGSEIRPKSKVDKSQFRYIAWGVVINHDDTTHEFFGGDKLHAQSSGKHEYIAFIEAVLRVKELGIDPRTATYYSDHDMIPFIGEFLHENNYKRSQREREVDRLRKLCAKFYDADTFELVLDTLRVARVVQLKGHRRHIYHSRCDYLATYASKLVRNIEIRFMQFDTWITRGIREFSPQGKEYNWYPPFANIN